MIERRIVVFVGVRKVLVRDDTCYHMVVYQLPLFNRMKDQVLRTIWIEGKRGCLTYRFLPHRGKGLVCFGPFM